MSTSVSFSLKSAKDKQTLIQAYAKYQKEPNATSIEYLFVLPSTRITIYKTGKVLFQGKDAQNEANRWSFATQSNTQTQPKKQDTLTAAYKLTQYIGCDETGVGDYFAPMVACCCYLDESMLPAINSLNIKDSKQLRDDYILQIAPKLMAIVPHAITSLSNERYNQCIENGYNSHAIKALIHNKALQFLFENSNLAPQTPIVMDAFTTQKNYQKYLKDIRPQFIPTIFETKAENKYLAVAISSIIGRAHFLNLMQKQNQAYQTIFPLGAGAKVDTFARAFLTKHSPATFKSLVKWHFANTDRIV